MFHNSNDSTKRKRILEISERDIRAARRLLGLIGAAEPSEAEARDPRPTKSAVDTSPSKLLARAHAEFENRRRRARFFGTAMFGEAGWEMLLALYLQHASGPRQTPGRLLQLAGMPPSTGKRWLDVLVEEGLIVRESHPFDARTYYVRLTDQGRDLLDTYFSDTIDSAL